MSVIIKGMNMPEHCGCCRFSYDGICHALQRMRYAQGMKDGKLADCPLGEFPTPHGRLIDADEITAFMELERNGANVESLGEFPTIIEAEGKEW